LSADESCVKLVEGFTLSKGYTALADCHSSHKWRRF